jgi:hypothetical protein
MALTNIWGGFYPKKRWKHERNLQKKQHGRQLYWLEPRFEKDRFTAIGLTVKTIAYVVSIILPINTPQRLVRTIPGFDSLPNKLDLLTSSVKRDPACLYSIFNTIILYAYTIIIKVWSYSEIAWCGLAWCGHVMAVWSIISQFLFETLWTRLWRFLQIRWKAYM